MVAAIAFGVRDVPHIDLIALLGSGILIAFGIVQFLRAGESVIVKEETRAPVALGLACTLGNPYWWVWWLTFGVGFLALHPAFVEFYVGHIGADIVWLGLLAFAVARGANVLGPPITKKWCRRADSHGSLRAVLYSDDSFRLMSIPNRSALESAIA
ncbi:LysE family translocator [Methanoculleus chikugoensis]|uniref:LysE family transporter n=1 Tax=Methanoculleus chikugoensis TaxID=118126 RepID=UPI001FB3DC13|nr:LysE family transporter [Methanoculleus chikugoensis]